VWLALGGALYAAQRLLAARFRFKMHEKTAARHKEDLLRQAYLSGLLFLAGRVGARINAAPLAFAALLVAFTFGFGLLFELIRHANVELTRDCVRNGYACGVLAFTALLVAALIANHLALVAARPDDPANGAAPFGAPQAVGLALFVLGAHGAPAASPPPPFFPEMRSLWHT